MARPPKSPAGPTRQLSINFDPEALAVIEWFQSKYPKLNPGDLVNASLKFLRKQTGEAGLDANCEPVNVRSYEEKLEQKMHAIAAEEAAKYAKDGPTKEKRRANDRQH